MSPIQYFIPSAACSGTNNGVTDVSIINGEILSVGSRDGSWTGMSSSGGMVAWRAEAFRDIGLAVSPSTHWGYERAVKEFESFHAANHY